MVALIPAEWAILIFFLAKHNRLFPRPVLPLTSWWSPIYIRQWESFSREDEKCTLPRNVYSRISTAYINSRFFSNATLHKCERGNKNIGGGDFVLLQSFFQITPIIIWLWSLSSWQMHSNLNWANSMKNSNSQKPNKSSNKTLPEKLSWSFGANGSWSPTAVKLIV